MWIAKNGSMNTIAYPVKLLPSFDAKINLVRDLSDSEIALRREQVEEFESNEAVYAENYDELTGPFSQQVDDLTIEKVDWCSVITLGDFDSIQHVEDAWRLDILQILEDLLYYDS